VEVEAFVDAGSIDVRFFEKPYILVPGKKAEKGYVLLRETLKASKKIGIARVVIRTREYLCAVMPEDDAIVLILLRYPQELVDPTDYKLPTGKASEYRITPKEMEMAKQLISSMSGKWAPDEYHDEFRERLQTIIQKRVKSKGATTKIVETNAEPEDAATNVVDFMSLLQKSLDSKKRTPASKSAGKAVAKVVDKPKKAARKMAAKAPAKKATKRKSA
jgi:DNA end-binding protein Ku